MSIHISADQVVMQELASRGVDSSVGVFGEHQVKIGNGSPIRLDEIKSVKVPSAGFGRMRQIASGRRAHLGRLATLGQLTPAQVQDKTWMFTQAVQNLSNAELAAAYQTFSSAEMDLLQTSLQREGEVNPKAKDARMAAERLFDLQALILRESANRATLAHLDDMRTDAPDDPTLKADALRLPKSVTEAYGSAGGAVVTAYENDMSAKNLGLLIETAASSATQRERTAESETQSLRNRAFDDVTLHEIGDVMRSRELTINMSVATLVNKTSILKEPSQPIDQMWSLKERGVETKCEGYQVKRDQVEQMHFPEIGREQDRGKTRPVYGALNLLGSKLGAAATLYGNAVIVLKKDVAKRATYTVNDSFYTVSLTIDKARRENFFKLFGGAPLLPDSLKAAMSKADSPERKAMEKWLDSMEEACRRGRNSSGKLCAERDIPSAIKAHLGGKDKDEDSLIQAMIGFIVKCFGDKEATRKTMATYDNMEALLSHVGQANSTALAEAAKERRTGTDPKFYLSDTAYIEAQIHGPIVPERDIEEIRVNLDDENAGLDDVRRAQAKRELKEFSRRTGVRVVFMDEIQEDYENEVGKLSQKAMQSNAAHHDVPAIEKRRDEIIANLKDETARCIESLGNKALEGQALDGKALDRVVGKFLDNIKADMERSLWDYTSLKLVEDAFSEAVTSVAIPKAALLKELPSLAFPNQAQMKAFAKWIMETGDDLTVDQMKLIHKHATAQADFLRTLAAANPPVEPGEALKGVAAIAKGVVDDLAVGGGPANAFANVSFASLALLASGDPPLAEGALAKLNATFGSSEMRTYVAQLDRVAHDKAFAGLPDAGAVDSLRDLIENNAANLAQLAGAAPWMPPKQFALPLELLDRPMRDAIETVSHAVANKLEFKHPMCPTFPKPANADSLPKTSAARRRFLVSVMEEYRQKELGKEIGRSFHGRGHIVRAYIYATAMANILAEQGVKVDFNAILCGIAGHDLARARPGKDKWEAQSGQMTVDAMKKAYGNGSLGEAYENEIIDSITGVEVELLDGTKMSLPKSQTLEAHILQSADSLDIGRVKDFDLAQFAFMQFGEKNLPENIAKLRDDLVKEADMLQRLTNPLCAKKEEMHRLMGLAAGNGPEAGQAAQDSAKLVNECEQQLIDEANDGDNEAFVTRVEDAIRNNPQHFPLLSKYFVQ